jgi:hypothetical protein
MLLDQITRPDPADKYDADIKIAKAASKLHLWRDTENQHRNFTMFLAKLTKHWAGCGDATIDPPTLDIDPAQTPCYMHDAGNGGHIILDKYSVISMLHEFGHHVGLDEAECRTYSEWVFANAFPVSFSKLERDARGFLCKPGTGVNFMAQAIADTRDIVEAETM